MKLEVFLGLVLLVSSKQIQPIPASPEGFVYGSPSANVTLDAFFELLCPESAAAFPGVYAYWNENQSWLRMVIHIFPLSYFYYSFAVSRESRFIQMTHPENFTSYVTWMFNHQSKYMAQSQQWAQQALFTNIAADTQAATGISFTQALDALSNRTYDTSMRISWKWAASLGITSAPTYMVNGIITPAASQCHTVEDWQNFFNSLF